MEDKPKGRPPKPSRKRKRLQYSVWVSAEEKEVIDQMIEESNLPASQFFLTQVIEKPIRRPRKKSLPQAVVEHVKTLGKLAGLLSLGILKTKDKDMAQSYNWQQSGRNVKWISELLTLYIFEDFDFPRLRQSLTKIKEQSYRLHFQLNDKADAENKAMAATLYRRCDELLTSFEGHYKQSSYTPFSGMIWEEDFDVHHRINSIKNEIVQR